MDFFNNLYSMIRSTPLLIVPVINPTGDWNYSQPNGIQYNPSGSYYDQSYITQSGSYQQLTSCRDHITSQLSTQQSTQFQEESQIRTRISNERDRSQMNPRQPKFYFKNSAQEELKILIIGKVYTLYFLFSAIIIRFYCIFQVIQW